MLSSLYRLDTVDIVPVLTAIGLPYFVV
jgi:hypothetical protein